MMTIFSKWWHVRFNVLTHNSKCNPLKDGPLTHKQRQTHGCVLSTVATDALVLKHQVTKIHSAYQISFELGQFQTQILRQWWTTLENKIKLKKYPGVKGLTHWGRVAYICVSKLTIIGSDNGLSPARRQAIIWTNAGILLIRTLGTNFREILSEILAF